MRIQSPCAPGKKENEQLTANLNLEEDKHATTNMQNGLVLFFLFSFIIFSYLWTKTVVKPLNSMKKSWRKKCEKVPKSAKIVPNDFAL